MHSLTPRKIFFKHRDFNHTPTNNTIYKLLKYTQSNSLAKFQLWHIDHRCTHRVVMETSVIVKDFHQDGLADVAQRNCKRLVPFGVQILEYYSTFVHHSTPKFELDIRITCTWVKEVRTSMRFVANNYLSLLNCISSGYKN